MHPVERSKNDSHTGEPGTCFVKNRSAGSQGSSCGLVGFLRSYDAVSLKPTGSSLSHPTRFSRPLRYGVWREGIGRHAGGDSGAATAHASGALHALGARAPHFPAEAKRVIHIFVNGGPSHVDTFDPKPALTRCHGKPLLINPLSTEQKTGGGFGSPFAFRKYGQSGMEVSELFSKTAESVDDICLIRSMQADVPNHEPSLMLMNCGDARQVRPSMA